MALIRRKNKKSLFKASLIVLRVPLWLTLKQNKDYHGLEENTQISLVKTAKTENRFICFDKTVFLLLKKKQNKKGKIGFDFGKFPSSKVIK